jgi:hypothetical protein
MANAAISGARYRRPRILTLPTETAGANISQRYQTRRLDMPSKPVNVKQVLVYLTHAQHAALLKLKAKLGVPVSEQIRGAIDRYLKQMKSRK